ncbi:hypothetical protein SLEP1_g42124 [Rubroshorea leprosula]|uniref:Uncharacterized protein n=1 Tax=Rubroshorea leprosula TaxID=152421 RepID=A0AAV5L965_9ROSI|nr:hypothetical protein SLEP1_g42124 [Rubroshorea leprosula]
MTKSSALQSDLLIYSNKAAAKATDAADPAIVSLFNAAPFGEEVGVLVGEVEEPVGEPPEAEFGGTATDGPELGAMGGAGGEGGGADGEEEGLAAGEGTEGGGDAFGEEVGGVIGAVVGGETATLGAGAGVATLGDLVGAGPGAWPRAALATRAKSTRHAKAWAISSGEAMRNRVTEE